MELATNWPLTLEAIWTLPEPDQVNPTSLHLQPVGSYPQGVSAYGVMDMAGNASEWVIDWYNWQGYQNMAERNPVGEGTPWNHVVRGSGGVDRLGLRGLAAELNRCSLRNSSHTANDQRIGFHCAASNP